MAATVQKERREFLTTDQVAGDFDQGYRYEGLSDNEDILKHPDIPKINTSVVKHETEFFAVNYRVELYNEDYANSKGTGRVVVHYSAHPSAVHVLATYVRWEMSYKKVDWPFPSFVRNSYWCNDPNQSGHQLFLDRWDEQGTTLPVELAVLQVTVNRISTGLTTRSAILADMALANAQMGHLHVITPLGNAKWIMQAPSFRQADAYRVETTYMWLWDPGNSTVSWPEGTDDYTIVHVLFPEKSRPSWHRYQVIPQRGNDGGNLSNWPKILVVDMFPATLPGGGGPNPYYEPDGWRTLPGKPFG